LMPCAFSTTLIALLFVSAQPFDVTLSGAAAWVYDTKGGEPAEWADDISAFNLAAKTPLSIIFSYGGDMEYYPNSAQPFMTYFPPASVAAAESYNSTPGVNHVITVIDGRMDGGEAYSPDLSKLTHQQLLEWAIGVAELYCSYDVVSGIQLDLEPFTGKYVEPFLVFLTALSANLRSPERNCVSSVHPAGRFITTFLFAEALTAEVWAALGPNGFATLSGYDLSSAPAGTASTPAFYGAQLRAALANASASAAAHNGSYFVGIPAAASAHEFETFNFANGTVVTGAPQLDYLETALVALAAGATGKPGYLGPALWGFSPEMGFAGNYFTPGNPFVDKGEERLLEEELEAVGARALSP
jgi:hypothetical protein